MGETKQCGLNKQADVIPPNAPHFLNKPSYNTFTVIKIDFRDKVSPDIRPAFDRQLLNCEQWQLTSKNTQKHILRLLCKMVSVNNQSRHHYSNRSFDVYTTTLSIVELAVATKCSLSHGRQSLMAKFLETWDVNITYL